MINTENKQLLKKLDGKSAKEFNKWFNETFEKARVKDEDLDTGYGIGLNHFQILIRK